VATVQRSFGSSRGELRAGNPIMLFNEISPPRNGSFWSAESFRYRLAEWTTAGELRQVSERGVDWFLPTGDGGIGGTRQTAGSHVAGIEMDSTGLLWVLINVPSPDWASAWPPDMGSGAGEVSLRALRVDRLYRTVVEVIDPARWEVVTRYPLELEGRIASAMPGNRAAVYYLAEEGVPKVSILQLRCHVGELGRARPDVSGQRSSSSGCFPHHDGRTRALDMGAFTLAGEVKTRDGRARALDIGRLHRQAR
jgi:hypothetical protein